MKIGLDVMGGDFAPDAIVSGAILAYKELPSDTKIVLIGSKPDILRICEKEGFDAGNFEIVHTEEVIGMGEHPAKAFQTKTGSSIVAGFKLLVTGAIDSFASAGNTGAMMVGAMFMVKSIPGIIRPAISAMVPVEGGKSTLLLDVGLNPDCRPDVLYQYGLIGSLYAKHVFQITNPRVSLLSNGSEEEKGNLVSKAAFELMKGNPAFNFVGNVEGNDIFSDEKTDVIVCDGFVGNVVLKEAEAFYTLIRKRKIKDEFFERFNFENYGGTPVLGINQPVLIGHGVSNAKAIKNMLIHSHDVVEAKLIDKLKSAFKE
jgi:phosphate acyltransferase